MDMDKVIRENFPLLAAPAQGDIQIADKAGVRYVVGKDGLWRAIDKSWLRAVTPVALSSTAVIPYGAMVQKIDFLCSMPPQTVWREFATLAKSKLPDEVAAAMVWDTLNDTWRLAERKSILANSAYVEYSEVELGEGEELVVDIHSHGHHPAGFSKIDDRDDFGSIKVSAVLGCVGSEAMEIAVRLMLIDTAIDLQVTTAGGWVTKEE